jgi:hypothetical protein
MPAAPLGRRSTAHLSLANASAHLKVLSQARLVVSHKQGLRVFYRLADPAVYRLWAALRETGRKQLAEIDWLVATYLHGRQGLEAVSREQLGPAETTSISARHLPAEPAQRPTLPAHDDPCSRRLVRPLAMTETGHVVACIRATRG